MKGFALRLVLKQRDKRTRKSPIAFLAFLLTSPPLAVVMSSRAGAFTQTGWQRNLDVKKILALYHSEENTSS